MLVFAGVSTLHVLGAVAHTANSNMTSLQSAARRHEHTTQWWHAPTRHTASTVATPMVHSIGPAHSSETATTLTGTGLMVRLALDSAFGVAN